MDLRAVDMQIALTGIVITEALLYMPAAMADHDNRSKPVMQVVLCLHYKATMCAGKVSCPRAETACPSCSQAIVACRIPISRSGLYCTSFCLLTHVNIGERAVTALRRFHRHTVVPSQAWLQAFAWSEHGKPKRIEVCIGRHLH